MLRSRKAACLAQRRVPDSTIISSRVDEVYESLFVKSSSDSDKKEIVPPVWASCDKFLQLDDLAFMKKTTFISKASKILLETDYCEDIIAQYKHDNIPNTCDALVSPRASISDVNGVSIQKLWRCLLDIPNWLPHYCHYLVHGVPVAII